MSFIVRTILLSDEGLQRVRVKQLCGCSSKSVRLSKGNLHCPPIKHFCRRVPSDHRFATKLCTPVLDVSILSSHSCSRIIQTDSDFPNLEWEGKVYGAARQKIISPVWWRFQALQRACGCGCHSLPHSEAFFIVPVSQQPKVTASSLSVL